MTEPAGRGAALKRHAMLALKVGVTIACFALLARQLDMAAVRDILSRAHAARSSRRWR